MFLLLGRAIHDSIFNYLPLQSKFQLAVTNKQFYSYYYNQLIDTVLTVKAKNTVENVYLFNTIFRVEVVSNEIDVHYLAKFINLQNLDVARVNFNHNLDIVKDIFRYLKALKVVYVNESQIDMFQVGLNFSKVEVELVTKKNGQKRELEELDYNRNAQVKKSRLLSSVQKKIADLELYQRRIKYATISPSSFLPNCIFSKLPELRQCQYNAIVDWEPRVNDSYTKVESIEYTIRQLKELLIHAVIVNQDNHWILISQVEVYYKDKSVDSIAFTTKYDIHPEDLAVKMEPQTNEGGGTWYELRVKYNKFEVIVTGGFSSKEDDPSRPVAFLGVGVPASLASDDHLIIFSPAEAAETVACVRMLRDYMRPQSLNRWCLKSNYFVQKEFHTPLPLELYFDANKYVYVASKLISLLAANELSMEEVEELKRQLNLFNYWKDLGFEEVPASSSLILARIKEIRASKQKKNLSEAKCTLIEVIFTFEEGMKLKKVNTTSIFNGLLYPKVKIINKKRVKLITQQLNIK